MPDVLIHYHNADGNPKSGLCGAQDVNETLNHEGVTCKACLVQLMEDLTLNFPDEHDSLEAVKFRLRQLNEDRHKDYTVIVEVRHRGETVKVLAVPHGLKHMDGEYQVWVDDVLRHPRCLAEDALRALGNYLHDNT